MGETRQHEPRDESGDLDVRSLVRLPSPDYCVRCGSDQSVDHGARRSCRACGATWQAD